MTCRGTQRAGWLINITGVSVSRSGVQPKIYRGVFAGVEGRFL